MKKKKPQAMILFWSSIGCLCWWSGWMIEGVRTNTLIDSFETQHPLDSIDEILLFSLKNSDSSTTHKTSLPTTWNHHRDHLRRILTQVHDQDHHPKRASAGLQPPTDPLQNFVNPHDHDRDRYPVDNFVRIKPNKLFKLRLRLNDRTKEDLKNNGDEFDLLTTDHHSYYFLITTNAQPSSASDPVTQSFGLNSIKDMLIDSIFRYLINPVLPGRTNRKDENDHRYRFLFRLSWDASEHIELKVHLDSPILSSTFLSNLDHQVIPPSPPSFLNLTIISNFDRFESIRAHDGEDSFVEVIVMIESLVFNVIPRVTVLPLIFTCLGTLIFIYLFNVPAKFERFAKNFWII